MYKFYINDEEVSEYLFTKVLEATYKIDYSMAEWMCVPVNQIYSKTENCAVKYDYDIHIQVKDLKVALMGDIVDDYQLEDLKFTVKDVE